LTKQLLVYREVVSSLSLPGMPRSGVRSFLEQCMKHVRSGPPTRRAAEHFLTGWIEGLEGVDFSDTRYKRVLMKTLKALSTDDDDVVERGPCGWRGTLSTRRCARPWGNHPSPRVSKTGSEEGDLFTLPISESCGFQGTVLSFDEAEQAADVGKKKRDDILSMLRSESDAIQNVRGASIFLLYASRRT